MTPISKGSAGTLIGFDDDFGTAYNATLRWTATESGTYYINARAWEPDPGDGPPTLTGSYTLQPQQARRQAADTDRPALHDADDEYLDLVFDAGLRNPLGDATLRSWTQSEINAVMAALATYSAVTPLTFSVAASQGAATWIFRWLNLRVTRLAISRLVTQYAAFDPGVADFTAGLVPGGNMGDDHPRGGPRSFGMAHPHGQGAVNYGANNSEVCAGRDGCVQSVRFVQSEPGRLYDDVV
ncbi:MAG: hypothetical protein R3C27_15910 [Hyphomonadaceae bacterium]